MDITMPVARFLNMSPPSDFRTFGPSLLRQPIAPLRYAGLA